MTIAGAATAELQLQRLCTPLGPAADTGARPGDLGAVLVGHSRDLLFTFKDLDVSGNAGLRSPHCLSPAGHLLGDIKRQGRGLLRQMEAGGDSLSLDPMS